MNLSLVLISVRSIHGHTSQSRPDPTQPIHGCLWTQTTLSTTNTPLIRSMFCLSLTWNSFFSQQRALKDQQHKPSQAWLQDKKIPVEWRHDGKISLFPHISRGDNQNFRLPWRALLTPARLRKQQKSVQWLITFRDVLEEITLICKCLCVCIMCTCSIIDVRGVAASSARLKSMCIHDFIVFLSENACKWVRIMAYSPQNPLVLVFFSVFCEHRLPWGRSSSQLKVHSGFPENPSTQEKLPNHL